MSEFKDLPPGFCCPYRDGCPYLEGLPTGWVFNRYQQVAGTECHYEYQLEELHKELGQERRQRKAAEREKEQLQAQLQALHRRQFKGRRTTPAPSPECASARRKKRGAPFGHPPWQRAKPTRIDEVVATQAPAACPDCGNTQLRPVAEMHEHVQEDIVLQPRTVVTAFRHQQAFRSRIRQIAANSKRSLFRRTARSWPPPGPAKSLRS